MQGDAIVLNGQNTGQQDSGASTLSGSTGNAYNAVLSTATNSGSTAGTGSSTTNTSTKSSNMQTNNGNGNGGWLSQPLTPGEILVVIIAFLAFIGLIYILFN